MKNNKNKNEQIAKQICDELISLTGKNWECGWKKIANAGQFTNFNTNKSYTGVNLVSLWLHYLKHEFKDTRYATFKQIKSMGGNVKENSKGCEILYFTQYDRLTKKEFDENAEPFASFSDDDKIKYLNDNVYLLSKTYWVFNYEQTTGIKLPEKVTETPKILQEKTNKICEEIIKNSQAKIYFMGNNAFYSPLHDYIQVPKKIAFNSLNEFYGTTLHEITHSTGAKSRLNRDLKHSFGSAGYAREELIAEMGSVFVQTQAGIQVAGKELKNHGEYIKNWLLALKAKNEQKELLRAIRQANKASEYIITNYIK